MKQINKLTFMVCAIALMLASCSSKVQKSKKIVSKPNILVVLCDDLGYSDVGFNGSKDIITPNLDQLADAGTVFTSAYVAHPFCGPSRASLMTGRYAHKIGAQFNLPPNSQDFMDDGIDINETFISKVLQESGYYTGIMGKWHLGSTPKYHPNQRGFDDFYGFLGGGHNYFPGQYQAAYKKQVENGNKSIFDYLLPLEHNNKEVKETEYITDALSRESVRFIKEAAQKEEPFFLYVSYNAPHVPLEAKEEDLKLFQEIKDEKRRTYAAMVYAVDRGINKIVESLKETGQFENTLIVFFSDNGGKLTKGATNFPLKEGKGSAHEGGYRVPMFFHWPNVVPAGEKFDAPVTALDLYPTFIGLAGAKLPEGKILDGKDIWKDFLNGKNPNKGEDIYVMRHRFGYSDVGVRKDEWKALKIYQQEWKLFNIEKDKSEEYDLSAEHPEILKDLVLDAEEWSKSNVEPKWFHSEEEGEQWQAMYMPKFDVTFKID